MLKYQISKQARFEHLKIRIYNLFRISDLGFRILFLFLLSSFLSLPFSFAAESKHAMVATADPQATQAALEVLQRGGNAVDAAIAAQWVLNVVEPQGSGLGGGAFFLYYDALTKHVYSFDGREAAPSEAHSEMFLDPEGKLYPYYPDRITGGLSVGVPGVLKLLETVHHRFGSRQFSFGALFDPAIAMAERGFPVSPRMARHLSQEKDRLKRFPASAQIFLHTGGEPFKSGEILFQPDLAGTFRLIQKEGISVFYTGILAGEIVKAVREAPFHPGLMKLSDLEHYSLVERRPLKGTYRSFTVYAMPPPSSGGAALIEALNILENYDLRSMNRDWKAWHVLAEAQAIAFEDRNRYIGDPAYSEIPLTRLLSKKYARTRMEEINFDFARLSIKGRVRNAAHPEGVHTSHISIVDAQGNIVSFTTTIEHTFGSAMVVPGRGFLLNNELTDFDPISDFGIRNAELRNPPAADRLNEKRQRRFQNSALRNPHSEISPNQPESDKRPRSSMTPVIIFQKDRPVLTAGSPGGATIISTVLNLVVNVLDYEMSLADALKASKLMHRGEMVELEPGLFEQAPLAKKLRKLGHDVMMREAYGNAQAIFWDPARGVLVGESDPRGEGQASGY